MKVSGLAGLLFDEFKERRIFDAIVLAGKHDIASAETFVEDKCTERWCGENVIESSIQSIQYIVTSDVGRVPDLVVQNGRGCGAETPAGSEDPSAVVLLTKPGDLPLYEL
jgi:hypothetical protein